MEISEFFEQDHQRLDAVMERFRHSLEARNPDRESFSHILAGLRRHIYWEEELLFPPVKSHGAAEIVDEFCTDHGIIWKNLAELESGLARGTPPGQLELTLNEMTEVLEAHNIDEERTVYAQANQLCSGEAAAEFLRRVEAADLPTGWRPVSFMGQITGVGDPGPV